MERKTASIAVQMFDSSPESALLDVNTACIISCRSRNSIYRHIKAGELTKVRVGSSTRIRVGELRKLIGAEV